MAVELIVARDPALLDRLYRFRYQIFTEEFGIDFGAAAPDGRLRDEYEDASINYVLLNGEEIVGGFRVVHPDQSQNPAPLIKRYELAPMIARFGLENVLIVGRLVLKNSARSGLFMARLLARAIADARCSHHRIACWDSSPSLFRLYERTDGFYSYGSLFIDSVYGPKKRFAAPLGAPFEVLFSCLPPDQPGTVGYNNPEATRWFEHTYFEDQKRTTKIRAQQGFAHFFNRIGVQRQSSLLQSLDIGTIDAVFNDAAIVDTKPGDYIRVGNVRENALFLVADGEFVTTARGGDQVQRRHRPGDIADCGLLAGADLSKTDLKSTTIGQIVVLNADSLTAAIRRQPSLVSAIESSIDGASSTTSLGQQVAPPLYMAR